MTSIAYLSTKVGIISQSHEIWAGFLGGTIVGLTLNEHVDANIVGAVRATAWALGATIVLFTWYNIILTSRYDIWLTDMESPQDELISQLMVYGVYEMLTAIYLFMIFLVGGIIGAVVATGINEWIRPSIVAALKNLRRPKLGS